MDVTDDNNIQYCCHQCSYPKECWDRSYSPGFPINNPATIRLQYKVRPSAAQRRPTRTRIPSPMRVCMFTQINFRTSAALPRFVNCSLIPVGPSDSSALIVFRATCTVANMGMAKQTRSIGRLISDQDFSPDFVKRRERRHNPNVTRKTPQAALSRNSATMLASCSVRAMDVDEYEEVYFFTVLDGVYLGSNVFVHQHLKKRMTRYRHHVSVIFLLAI